MLATLRKNLSTSDLRFVQVIEVEKREPRESFLNPRPQAEAEKCFLGSLSTEVTWEKLKSDVDKFCQREWQEQILKQNAFFICAGFFVSIPNLVVLKSL